MASNLKKIKKDPLAELRKQVHEQIKKQYPTIEKFCYENDLQKSTMSRFLNGEHLEYKISTLEYVARALGKKLRIKLE